MGLGNRRPIIKIAEGSMFILLSFFFPQPHHLVVHGGSVNTVLPLVPAGQVFPETLSRSTAPLVLSHETCRNWGSTFG